MESTEDTSDSPEQDIHQSEAYKILEKLKLDSPRKFEVLVNMFSGNETVSVEPDWKQEKPEQAARGQHHCCQTGSEW